MRVGTLFDPDVESFLADRFVLVTHNQLPELYCQTAVIDATSDSPYPAEQMARVTEGGGGGNVRCYFCTPEGKVVHYLSGYWKPRRLLIEARWALARVSFDSNTLVDEHRFAAIQLERERDQVLPPDTAAQFAGTAALTPQQQAALTEVRAYNRLIRSYRESSDIARQGVVKVLQRVEDEVYTKGTLGCDS